MKVFYYTHTGHRFTLARFRKAVAIINSFPDFEITLLTSDYKIASFSKEFGIKKAIGIDVLRNIPNVANHGDILIYDSDEHNEEQLQDMIYYFSKFIRLSTLENDVCRQGEFLINPYIQNSDTTLNHLPVQSQFFGKFQKDIDVTFFFGDDDYDKDLLKYAKDFGDFKPNLLLGFYYFIGYEDELSPYFEKIFEVEDYDEVIQKSKVVVTSSYQTALETLASGGKPIYIEREDRDDSPNKFLSDLGIPVLKYFDSKKIIEIMNQHTEYKKISNQNSQIQKKLEVLFKVENTLATPKFSRDK